jgi:hypothetical protein
MATFRQGLNRGGQPASLIAMCCVCGLVRLGKTVAEDPDRWVTKRSYEQMYGIKLVGNPVTHTYCSGCHTDFMQRIRPRSQSLTNRAGR